MNVGRIFNWVVFGTGAGICASVLLSGSISPVLYGLGITLMISSIWSGRKNGAAAEPRGTPNHHH